MRLLSALLLFFIACVPAWAVDGVIEINQAAAEAGEVTPGDAPGLPVTISLSGSYRLTGDLTLPDENTDGIRITTDNVNLDLGGFSIIGPTVCTVTGTPTVDCSPTGTGVGINGQLPTGAAENIVVRNGTVRGAGSYGIFTIFGRVERVRMISNGASGVETLGVFDGTAPGFVIVDSWALRNGFRGIGAGQRGRVEGSVANLNGELGIQCSDGCVVRDNTTNANGGSPGGSTGGGIFCFRGCIIENNSAVGNVGNGITSGQSVVRGNTAIDNTEMGLDISSSGYADNVLSGNTAGNVNASAVPTGGNVCNGSATCP